MSSCLSHSSFQFWYFQLTSCTCNLEREYIEAVESTNEPQVLPKEMSRKELYVYDDEIKQARTLGVGFASHAIER